MNRSQAVAGRVLGITPDSLSDADYEQLARLIFDYAGCAYSGTAQPAGRGMRAERGFRLDGLEALPHMRRDSYNHARQSKVLLKPLT